MSFLLPLFLGAGALVGVPLVLHFLRSRTRTQVVFPTLRFLGPTAVRETNRHRLRRWLTLLLRCLVILLVCFAFARPFWTPKFKGTGHAVVIAVDNSFSMQASGRWEEQVARVQDRIRSLRPGDQAGIILMNPSPSWLLPVTRDLDQVRNVFSQLKPGFETTRYEGALRLAGDALARTGAPHKTLLWLADEQRLGWQRVNFTHPLPPGVEVQFPPPSPPVKRQAAITKARWEGSGKEMGLRVTVSLFVPANDKRTLTLTSAGQVVSTATATLMEGAENSVFLPAPGAAGKSHGTFKIEMDADDLPVDDTFYTARQQDDAKRVFLSAPADEKAFDFLKAALEATRQVNTGMLKAGEIPSGEWPVHSVFILRGNKPFEAPLSGQLELFLKKGGAAWLILDGSPAQTAWLKAHRLESRPLDPSENDAPRHLQNWDADHPMLAPLKEDGLTALLSVNFYKGISLTGFDAGRIATWEDGTPAIAEVSTEGMHFIVSGFDFDRATSNWPLQASFLPFVHSTVLWLSQQQRNTGDWRVGDSIPLSEEGTWSMVDSPLAPAPDVLASGSIRPVAPGLYAFRTPSETRFYPVNLPPEESDLSPWPEPDELAALQSKASATSAPESVSMIDLPRDEAENHQRIWWWCLALAALFLLMELRLANRTSM